MHRILTPPSPKETSSTEQQASPSSSLETIKRAAVCIRMLSSFIRFVFLEPTEPTAVLSNGFPSDQVLTWLVDLISPQQNLIQNYWMSALKPYVLDLLLSVVESTPTTTSFIDLTQPARILKAINTPVITLDATEDAFNIKRRMILSLVAASLDGRHLNRSLLGHLSLLQRLMKGSQNSIFVDEKKDFVTFSIVAAALSYLLLDTADLAEERTLLIDLIKPLLLSLKGSNWNARMILTLAIFPLIQIMSESDVAAARAEAFELLKYIEHNALTRTKEKAGVTDFNMLQELDFDKVCNVFQSSCNR
jgi:hypothetical protein